MQRIYIGVQGAFLSFWIFLLSFLVFSGQNEQTMARSDKDLAASNHICSETFHKILSLKGIRLRGEIQGGSDVYTRRMFSLPSNLRLPFLYYNVVFPEEVDAEKVNQSFREAAQSTMANYTVCSDAVSRNTQEHSFFLFLSHGDLKSSLEQSCPKDDKQDISMVYSLLSKSVIRNRLKPSQRKCLRVLLHSFILYNAGRLSDRYAKVVDHLHASVEYKHLGNSMKVVGQAQRSLLENAIAKNNSNLQQPQDSTANLANAQEHGSPSSRDGHFKDHVCHGWRLIPPTVRKNGYNYTSTPDSVLSNGKRQKLVEPTMEGTQDPDSSATVSEQFSGDTQEVMSAMAMPDIEAAIILSEIRTKNHSRCQSTVLLR